MNTEKQQDQLYRLLEAGDDNGSLNLIREIEHRGDWPAPARERVIFEYVSSLRLETPQAVGIEVIEYLRSYQSTVFIPHEDHATSSVPMFNIKGAAAGVVNAWSRQESAFLGAAQISANPEALVQTYLAEQNLPRRQGLVDSLSTATAAQLKAISISAMNAISENPELVALAGQAALLSSNLDTLEQLAERARGPHMNSLLRRSAEQFDAAQNTRLLRAALRNPSHEIGALAIAQLSPALTGHAPTEELLLRTLSDSNLGASAALALAMNPSPRVLQSLERMADSKGNEVSVSRARLALQIHASRFRSKAQP